MAQIVKHLYHYLSNLDNLLIYQVFISTIVGGGYELYCAGSIKSGNAIGALSEA